MGDPAGTMLGHSQQYNKVIRGITPKTQIVLSSYSWPGNIRELENVIGHACIISQEDMIDVLDLPAHLRAASPREMTLPEDMLPLAELHRTHVMRALERAGGNKAMAARILGINRATLYRLLKRSRMN